MSSQHSAGRSCRTPAAVPSAPHAQLARVPRQYTLTRPWGMASSASSVSQVYASITEQLSVISKVVMSPPQMQHRQNCIGLAIYQLPLSNRLAPFARPSHCPSHADWQLARSIGSSVSLNTLQSALAATSEMSEYSLSQADDRFATSQASLQPLQCTR